MPYYPILEASGTQNKVVATFKGYNHALKVLDGEFFDMKNLCSDYFPLLGSRAKRGDVRTLTTPKGVLAKAKLAYIDGTHLYYDGVDVTSYLTTAGVAIGSDSAVRQMVSMGAYIVIFPDKIYFNTEDYDDCGSLDNNKHMVGADSVGWAIDAVFYCLCKNDGTEYGYFSYSGTAPDTPESGDLWFDRAAGSLKEYNGTEWIEQSEYAVRIGKSNIGKGCAAGDYVDMSGFGNGTVAGIAGQPIDEYDFVYSTYDPFTGTRTSGTGNMAVNQIKALNGRRKILACDDNYIVIEGLVAGQFRETYYDITLGSDIPDMDYVTEAQNRLWGCKYGVVNGETVNEIYACALGDFKNWKIFDGISTDSYVASVGTDGPWTGAITHMGSPLFFKENYLHKVFVSAEGAHNISDLACRGVQRGSSKSLVVVNETLFYKAQGDVMAYDGSLPKSVSAALGQEQYKNAVAGSVGSKYYISMEDTESNWHLFVLDTAKALWHREDNFHAIYFARMGEELYAIKADGHMLAMRGSVGTAESSVDWSFTSALLGGAYVNKKYISRINMRVRLPVGSRADCYIQYDSDGLWRFAGHAEGKGTGTFTLPIRPQRCDHWQYKVEGRGELKMLSMSCIYEIGSDK